MTTPVSPRAAALGGRILRTRWLMRAPIWLYRARLGALLGSRTLMVEHIGRTSGARRYVVLETFGHPDPATYLIVSGFGTKAQWFRNLMANPDARVWVASRRPVPAVAERLDDAAADAALEEYVRRHPKAWGRLRPVVEDTLGRPIDSGADIPIVALHLQG
jgi:deazaflavin-dependent oxidoreductase (nitroreductase family)